MFVTQVKILFSNGDYAITNGKLRINDLSTRADLYVNGRVILGISAHEIFNLEAANDAIIPAGVNYIRYNEKDEEITRI